MISALFAGFKSGDPAAVFAATVPLVASYREVIAEAARLRFVANFNTSICHSCDGLRAGPGVVATCFQVQQCWYDNIKEGSESERHKRVLRVLRGE